MLVLRMVMSVGVGTAMTHTENLLVRITSVQHPVRVATVQRVVDLMG